MRHGSSPAPSKLSNTSCRARGAARGADAGNGYRRAFLRRKRRHAAGDSCAVRRAHQQGLGPRAAQTFLPVVQFRTAGRRHRQRPEHLARASSTAFLSPTFFISCTAKAWSRCSSKRCWLLRFSPRAGAGSPDAHWRCCASWAGKKSRRRFSACAPTICSPPCFRKPRRARKIFQAISRFPIIRSCAKR